MITAESASYETMHTQTNTTFVLSLAALSLCGVVEQRDFRAKPHST